MTTINLQQNQQSGQLNRSNKRGNGGFIFSLGILLITLLALAGFKYYVPLAEAKNVALDADIAAKNLEIVDLKSLVRVVDLQQRISEIKTNLQLEDNKVTRYEITQILDQLSSDMDKGIVVSSFQYNGDGISLAYDASNYSEAAKQLQNFKVSGYFTDVELTGISRNESGISCNVTMAIKKTVKL